MQDRSWLLNAPAIAAAKKCISAVKDESGVKLKLSDEQFIERIEEYATLKNSTTIRSAFEELMSYSDFAMPLKDEVYRK